MFQDCDLYLTGIIGCDSISVFNRFSTKTGMIFKLKVSVSYPRASGDGARSFAFAKRDIFEGNGSAGIAAAIEESVSRVRGVREEGSDVEGAGLGIRE